VSTYPDHILRVGSEHLAELKRKAAEFERQLWDAHESLEQEIEQTAYVPELPMDEVVPEAPVDGQQQSFGWTVEQQTVPDADGQSQLAVARAPSDVDAAAASGSKSPRERTARLIDHGRRPPKPTHRSRKVVLVGLAAAVGAVLLTVLVLDLFRPGHSPAADRDRVPQPGRQLRAQPGQLRLR
jgi:uncharacterized protein YdcH (DUF465 family)